MRIRDAIECVTAEIAQEYKLAEELVFPANVREVAAFAFQDAPNLISVEFEEGIRSIGTCAFARCGTLRSVHLPQSICEIKGGAFRECCNLQTVTFNPVTESGDCIPLAPHVFTDCQVDEHVIRHENNLRRDFHLHRIFERVEQEELFREWIIRYRSACQKLARVENWDETDVDMLRFLIADQDNGIAKIGEGESAMAGGAMQSENYSVYRGIATAICEAGRTNDWDLILPVLRDERDRFFGLFHHKRNAHPWLVFNRIVAGLLPSFVVNVPKFEDLKDHVYDWLAGRHFMVQRKYGKKDWFELSYQVRQVLAEHLHMHDIFECGVFAWCLAERKNGGMRDNDERLPDFRKVIANAIDKEADWFQRNASV